MNDPIVVGMVAGLVTGCLFLALFWLLYRSEIFVRRPREVGLTHDQCLALARFRYPTLTNEQFDAAWEITCAMFSEPRLVGRALTPEEISAVRDAADEWRRTWCPHRWNTEGPG